MTTEEQRARKNYPPARVVKRTQPFQERKGYTMEEKRGGNKKGNICLKTMTMVEKASKISHEGRSQIFA